MNELPPEILCHIFLLALPYPIHPYMYTVYRESVTVPLRISHVCRAWRELSISFRELWSYLCINCFAYTTGSVVRIFNTWLERTNEAPLNFYVSCDGHWEHDLTRHRDAEYIITTMISQQHRWKEVKFIWRGIRLSPDFPELKLTNMPMLESLILISRIARSPRRANINIARSSRLVRLVLQEMDMDIETGEQPLYSLTELGDLFFDYADRPGSEVLHMWLNFLKATPNLREFRACSARFSSPPPFRPHRHPEPFITLPNLQVIKLETFNIDAASYILDYVTLPRLEYLLFASDPIESNKKGPMLVSFFRRSLPPLTSLIIQWHVANEDFIIHILPLLPTLKYLRIAGVAVSRRLFDQLTITAISSTINNMDSDSGNSFDDRHMNIHADFDIGSAVCPALETLFLERLKFGADSRSPCLALITMLKSRAKALRKFRNVYFRDGGSRAVLDPPLVTRVNLSVIDEDIAEFRRRLTHFLLGHGVVFGNDEAVDSLLVRGR